MGRLAAGTGGSGFWTGAGVAECPTLAHAGAASSLAVPGQGPRPVPRGGPHPRGQSHCSTGDGGRTSERRGSEQTQEERGHFSGQCMRGNGGKGEVVLCWGRAKTRGRRNPPGESARTRGLPGPRRACQGQAASVCPSLGGRTPRPRHCLQRGRVPAPLLLSIQPCVAHHGAQPPTPPPPAHLLPDRADRTGWTGKADSLCSHPAPLPLPDSAPPSPGPPR